MSSVNSLGAQELGYLSGLSATQGYQVLNKNMAQAVTAFEKTQQSQSAISYFEQTVPTLTSVNQFLSNTRLVDFVLSAFGLDQEDNYQGLIKQVLTQDPNASNSLVNQLSDPRFKQLATALDFYSDGLGQLQAAGLSDPTGATTAEGVSLTSTASTTEVAQKVSTPIVTTSVNTNIAVGIGVELGSNQYFSVTESDGTTTGYAQSGYFTVNENGQLGLPDGSTLNPPVTVPSDATSLSIDANGVIQAQEQGQSTPTVIGQLQTYTFSDPTQLSTDTNGYYSPTTGSGSATAATAAGAITTFGATNQVVTTVSTSSTSSSPTVAVSTGVGVSGNQYLVLQQPNGNTVYAQSAYFTVNNQNELALPDGSTLQPSFVLPDNTTAVTVTSAGAIYALAAGQTTPTSVGQLETATFSNPAALSKNNTTGYYTPTLNSGSAVVSFSTGTTYTFGNTLQSLVNDYVQNEFEVAVGDENTGVREALYFQRSISPDEAAVATYSTATKADVILGDSVLSNVAETILDQPAQIAYEQLSSQENIIENGIQLNQLQSETYVASLTARYLSMYDATTSSATETSASPALQILSAFGSSSSSSSSSGSSLLSLFT